MRFWLLITVLFVARKYRYLLGENYHRINPLLSKNIPLDDVSSLDMLREIAEAESIDETLRFVREHITSFRDADEIDWGVAHAADTDGSGDIDLQYAHTRQQPPEISQNG